jgi:hypothetical protein
MKRECGATAYLPPRLTILAANHLKNIRAEQSTGARGNDLTDFVVENWLQCFLEEHSDGSHYGLVTDTIRGVPDVWATWSGENQPTSLTHIAACTRNNGKEGGLQDSCSLFSHHPGQCTFDLIDPEAESIRTSPEYVPDGCLFEPGTGALAPAAG